MLKLPPGKSPDLYHFFLIGALQYLIDPSNPGLEVWSLVPNEHIGRQQSVALIRKMANRMVHQFPGGIGWFSSRRLTITPMFRDFLLTHQRMGSTMKEAMEAWSAIKDLDDGT